MRDLVVRPSFFYAASLLCLGALSLVGCAQSDASDPQVTVLAAAGDAAPGLPEGYEYEGFQPGVTMGASGEVAFAATANVDRGGPRERKEALWFGTPADLEPVAMIGDALTGLGDDVSIMAFATTPRVITRSGQLGFVVQTSASPRGTQPQALFVYGKGKLKKVIASGDPVPLTDGDSMLLRIDQFVMTDEGVLFMGKFARNKAAVWFWDGRRLQRVIEEDKPVMIGKVQCSARSVVSTSLDVNDSGLAVFRVSLRGSECPRSGIVAWRPGAEALIPVAMHLVPIHEEASLAFQSLTADARVSDQGAVALHADIYDSGKGGAREMTLLQTAAGGPSRALIDKSATFTDVPDLTLTHTILGDGLGVIDAGELVHFVKSNRDRIILRTTYDDAAAHSVVAHTGTLVEEQEAARIGDAHVNRRGDIAFTSFIDDGPKGGNYQQEVWFAPRKGETLRLAYAGQAVTGRGEDTIERIEMTNQFHEPHMHNTQGGRERSMSDAGEVMFAGRLRSGSGWRNALFVAAPRS